MPNLQRFGNGESPVASSKLNLIVDALTGAGNTPINHGGVNDAVNYALLARNQDPAGKHVIVYSHDGTTVLFQITDTGVLASPAGGAAGPLLARAAGSVTKVVLDTSLATDVWSATNLAAGDNPITGLTTLSFTIDEAIDYLLVVLRASAFVIPSAGSAFGWDILIDGALSKRLGRTFVATSANGAIPGGIAYITGLTVGAHTVSINFWANAAQTGAAYLRTATQPAQEFAQVTLIEVRA